MLSVRPAVVMLVASSTSLCGKLTGKMSLQPPHGGGVVIKSHVDSKLAQLNNRSRKGVAMVFLIFSCAPRRPLPLMLSDVGQDLELDSA